ncbi:MAG: tetratricopeptide repeat protein [Paracoccaceae bacterium]|nr:tetratricopeptide repeat protein [Paracoccaceae bacterium]
MLSRARAAANHAKDLLPENPDWPEVSNLASQPAPQHFVKRKENDDLMASIARAEGTVVQAAVAGMGGIGKTTLAIAAARAARHRFAGVWVLPAANIDTLQNELIALAETLDTPSAKNSDRATAAKSALNAVVQSGQPWLLIYDNADDPALAQAYSPAEADNVTLIYTSRATSWPDHFRLDLGRMTPAESLELLRESLPQRDRNELAEVAERLGHWPLALTAAAGYLAENPSTTVAEYLAGFDASKTDMTELHWSGCAYYDPDRPETFDIAAALALTTDGLADAPRALLSILCFLNPDDLWPEVVEEGVTEEITNPFDGQALPHVLTQVAGDGWVRRAMDGLRKVSLVAEEMAEGAPVWRLHRLVAEFWRVALGDDAAQWSGAAARIVNAKAPYGASSPSNWETYRRLLPQARALLAAGAADAAAARLLHQIGGYALHRGVQKGDLDFARSSVEINEALAPDSAELAASLNNLGGFQKALGDPAAALESYIRARDIQAKLPEIGPRHPSYAATLNNIAGVHRDRQAFAEAEALHVQAREIFAKELRPEHPSTIRQDRNLGAVCGEWAATVPVAEAAPLWAREATYKQAALDAALQSLGPRHPNVAVDRNNSALRLRRDGARDAALLLMRQAAATCLDLLGPGHGRALRFLRAYLDMAQAAGEALDAALQALVAEAAAVRQAHREWGAARLHTLCTRYGIEGEDGEAKWRALVAVADVKAAALERDGAPHEAWTWVQQEVREALYALMLDPDPGAAFVETLQTALATLEAQDAQ